MKKCCQNNKNYCCRVLVIKLYRSKLLIFYIYLFHVYFNLHANINALIYFIHLTISYMYVHKNETELFIGIKVFKVFRSNKYIMQYHGSQEYTNEKQAWLKEKISLQVMVKMCRTSNTGKQIWIYFNYSRKTISFILMNAQKVTGISFFNVHRYNLYSYLISY